MINHGTAKGQVFSPYIKKTNQRHGDKHLFFKKSYDFDFWYVHPFFFFFFNELLSRGNLTRNVPICMNCVWGLRVCEIRIQ